MAKETKDIGHIRLSDLDSEVTTKKGVPGIWIPFPTNACIFVNEKDNRTTVDLDIEVIPTPRSQYSDKMVKASLPKSYRLAKNIRFDTEEYKKLTPILGNLKTYEFEKTPQNPPRQQTPADDFDDLPSGLDGDGDWGGQIPEDKDWK